MIKVALNKGEIKEFEQGITALEVAKQLSNSLAKSALVAEVDGKLVDLDTKLNKDCSLSIKTFDDEDGKRTYRHTTSHILAQAIKRLFPNTKLAIGPSIENGFYYDFDSEKPFTTDDLNKIENEMQKIIKENLELKRFELPREEAIALMEKREEPYKVELIKDLPEGEIISFYQQGDYIDLCTGPHVHSTGKIKNVKLLSVAGAYWRGSEKNKMLQRIYGTCFPKKSDLDDYIFRMEEAKKRDHRKIGKELDLFSIQEEGPGFPFFHPNGMIIRNELEDFWKKEHRRHGYKEVKTPMILNRDLWIKSGHWDHYKENMYFTKIDDQDYAIKPMNCPGGILIYKRKIYSYRDLPVRLGELVAFSQSSSEPIEFSGLVDSSTEYLNPNIL